MIDASRRDVVWLAVVIVLLSVIWSVSGDSADAGVGPPPGEGIDVVYVAVGGNFPDALGVGPGAGVVAAPILLVPTSPPLPAVTAAELERLDPRRVVIVGGPAVVSSEMEAAIETLLPNATVDRIGGSNRYETNVQFSQSVFPVERWITVSGLAFLGNSPATDDVFLGQFASSVGGVLNADIQLPDGATILEVRGGGHDSDDSNDIAFRLVRRSIGDGINVSDQIAEAMTSGDTGNQVVSDTSMAAGTEIVDNENWYYHFNVSGAVGGSRYIFAAQVKVRLGSP